ncbi:hypothetical protein EDD16DRAFT_1516126 [Pisolithus croceorrhizus]|nr:hypothetical protein EDD16DRAFT_1516126 [Pisolithus croceorrhizus]KAI6133937.1 hypothetical protein EV401DRAFT_1883103 [Pisolithus croceorrhizus]KAI6162885.1 hypothetical protein EDD17DRAFT_1507739 [Pisolithus thermaeus]
MFCNLKTDWLGPKQMVNKAATQVKKSSAITGGVKDCDEVDALKSNNGNSFQKNSHEESEMKSSNDGVQDLYANSVDTEYKQPLSSCKHKVKITMSSCKLKIITDSNLGNEPPLSLAEEVRGKQPARPTSVARKTRSKRCIPSSQSMVITSDEEPALCEALIHKMSLSAEPDWLSTEHHLEKSVGPHNKLPLVEQPKQSLSVNPCTSSSQVIVTTKEAAKECSKSAPAAEHAIEHSVEPPSVPDIEMSAAPGVAEQKMIEEAVNLPGHIQMSAEAGLISGNQEGRLVPEGSDKVQHSNVLLEVPGCKAIYPPIPPPASYDATNPFAHHHRLKIFQIDFLGQAHILCMHNSQTKVKVTTICDTTLTTTVAVSHLDGNGNTLASANHPPDIFGGDKDTQENNHI